MEEQAILTSLYNREESAIAQMESIVTSLTPISDISEYLPNNA